MKAITSFRLALCAAALGASTLLSCQETKIVAYDIPTIDFPINTSERITDHFKSAHCIQLECNDDCIIKTISKIYDVNDTLVILSGDDKVYTFSKKDGRFLHTIASRGEGPEQYLAASDITISPKNEIVVADNLKRRLAYYTAEGRFVKEEPIKVSCGYLSRAELTADNSLLFSQKMAGGQAPNATAYCLTDRDKKEKRAETGTVEGLQMGNWMMAFAAHPMAKSDSGIAFLKVLNDTIFRMDRQNNIFPLFKMKTKHDVGSMEALSKYGKYDFASLYHYKNDGNFCPGFTGIYETDKLMLIVPMFIRDDGYYWIDKSTKKGTLIPSCARYDNAIGDMTEGRTILNVVGSNDKELICAFEEEEIGQLGKTLAKLTGKKPFDKQAIENMRKADAEGNPLLLFYEH